MTIGLLGGSFNPAHDGHLAISLYALKHMECNAVWWLVSPQNPLKPGKDMAALNARMARAEQMTAAHPRLVVTDIETHLGTRYTADTLRALRRRFPHTRFVWLMGGDNLRQIPRWRDWQDIFHTVPVAVFRRPSYIAGRGFGHAAIRFGAFWHPPAAAHALSHTPLPAWTVLDNKLNYISATQIRKDNPTWPAQKRKRPAKNPPPRKPSPRKP
ncbi:MAG: nicotinate-nucleotide adenylyltransferase [Alphaproteobacteria bacterium]|nr:nicotinate-nucleotide adenylyltransferase [Alphaproteobacteria bacterium]